VVVNPGTVSAVVPEARFVPFPYDFELRFSDTPVDTSLVLAFGQQAIPIPFSIYNRTLDRAQDVILVEDDADLRNGAYDHGDLIILVDGLTPTSEPVLQGGAWTGGWAIRFVPPDPAGEPGVEPVPPSSSAVLRFGPSKPFATGDHLDLAFKAGQFDAETASRELDDIYVVPNPYVATSTFEPANPYLVGRGERRIYFMGLPPACTIRIYTITGDLVRVLSHSAPIDDGQEAWDLTSTDGMDVAFGVYIFHVEAPGVGESVGRFALIK
jgi:hypothetical protein